MGKNGKLSILILFFLAALVVFHYLNWLRPAENLVVRLVSPVQGLAYGSSLKARGLYQSWLSKKDYLAENRRLQDELIKHQLDQAEFNRLQSENELLKKELGFVQETKAKTVAAKIISGSADSLTQSIIIDRGTSDGIVRGLAVVADQGVLVGKVIEANQNYSKVLLLTDSQSRVAATIQNKDQTIGLVEGSFGLNFSMTNIPRDQEIKEGDLIVTSGLEGQIPRNLLIAQVDGINQIESEIFKTAVLKPIISFDNLSRVLVILPN